APYVHHQRVSRRLLIFLHGYFAPRDPTGEVFNAPIDMALSDTNVIQPDLIYIPGESSEIVEEKRIGGAPLLVVEILSRWTRSK
ncbi:MAG TPA: DNA-binding protein, partial [Firmicutes bacterium]|nr:DNA-binding protein [Bacillota bacterium]